MRRRITGVVSAFATDWTANDQPARLPDLNVEVDTGAGILLGTRNWHRITKFSCGPFDGDPLDQVGSARYLLRDPFTDALLYDWTQTNLNVWQTWPVDGTPLFIAITSFALPVGTAEIAEVLLADGSTPAGEQQ